MKRLDLPTRPHAGDLIQFGAGNPVQRITACQPGLLVLDTGARIPWRHTPAEVS